MILAKTILIITTLFTPTPQHAGEVYHIAAQGTKYTKIGVTGYGGTAARLKQLQTGSPYKLTAVRVQPTTTRQEAFKLEKELHSKHAAQRVRADSEWFKLEKEKR